MVVIELLLLIITLFEIKTGHHLPASTYYRDKGVSIPTGVFTNPNDLSVVMVMFFPFLYYLTDYFENRPQKILITLFTIIIVFVTMSRVALALPIGFSAF